MTLRWRGLGPAIFWLDLAIALCGSAMISLAVVLEWVLPPGRGRRFLWLGLSRHEWGDVHFWVGVALAGLVTVHLLHHWHWIASRWRGSIGSLTSVRTWLVLGLMALILALPALIPAQGSGPETGGHGHGHGRRALEDRPGRG